MDDRTTIAEKLRPVIDAAAGLHEEFATPEEALQRLREVEVAVGLATDLLMGRHLQGASRPE